MNKKHIAEFIRHWMVNQKGLSANDIDLDENFFHAGWVDSLGMFRLIFELESEFDCILDQTSLFCDARPTINSIACQVSLQLSQNKQ